MVNSFEWRLKKQGKRPDRAFIWNETYGHGCYILWGVTREQFRDEYRNVNRLCDFKDHQFTLGRGKFVLSDGIACMAFRQKRPSVNTIAHECSHMTTWMLDCTGINTTMENDEPQAYLLGWTVERVYRLTRGLQ